ncbi:MAG: hypothetical protein VKJ64_18565 [Leptolyngbyaceae bacterium]|nr:hypothetical protein [Leptolyngbyaceae bacterium]
MTWLSSETVRREVISQNDRTGGTVERSPFNQNHPKETESSPDGLETDEN